MNSIKRTNLSHGLINAANSIITNIELNPLVNPIYDVKLMKDKILKDE